MTRAGYVEGERYFYDSITFWFFEKGYKCVLKKFRRKSV